jgi:hypothetical protein
MVDTQLSGRRLAGQDDVLHDICFFAEQLEEVVELERSGRGPKQRIALVAADSLAEVVLYRHALSFFEASEGAVWWRPDAYPLERRRAILRDFRRKVALGEKRVDGPMTFHYPEPVLDRFDATVFRIAHSYRNAVHHRGDHNAALAGPLTRLYAGAVGRSFVRSIRGNSNMGGVSDERLAPVVALGWHQSAPGQIAPRAAAMEIMDRVCGSLEVERGSLCARLREDLEERADQIDGRLNALRRLGLDDVYLALTLGGAQVRAAHSADNVLVRLQEQEAEIMRSLMATEEEAGDDTYRRVEAIRQSRSERMDELTAQFEPLVDLGTSLRVRQSARHLGRARDVSALVVRYQPLDEQLDVLAGAVDVVVRDWERQVEDEIDRRRGK